jgi:hypothetical protein
MRPLVAPLSLALPALLVWSGGLSCKTKAPPPPSAPGPIDSGAPATSLACTTDATFPPRLDIPEASGAVEVELRKGVRELLVVSDSGRKGAALAYALPDGPARELRLPLDPSVTDDTEGLAWRGHYLYALVSTGYVQRFSPTASGELVRDGAAYALGAPPYSSPNAKETLEQPPDFEGLCLRGKPGASPSPCDGYAASRAYGWLVCLVFDGDRLKVHPVHPRLTLDVKKRSLSDCAFGTAGGPAEDVLLVTTNLRGGSTVSRVDEATGALSPIDVEGTLNNEAIVVDREGRLYQLADSQEGPSSPTLRASCTGW